MSGNEKLRFCHQIRHRKNFKPPICDSVKNHLSTELDKINPGNIKWNLIKENYKIKLKFSEKKV